MRPSFGLVISVVLASVLAGCTGVDEEGGVPAAPGASGQISEFETELDRDLTTLAVSLEGLDSASIVAVASTDEAFDVSVVSQSTGVEPEASVIQVGEGARLSVICARTGQAGEACSADIELSMPADMGLIVTSLTEVHLTTSGVGGDQSFTLGDQSTVTVAGAGGDLKIAPAASSVTGISQIVGTGLASEQVDIAPATQLWFGGGSEAAVSLVFTEPPASLRVLAANGGTYTIEVPRYAPDGSEAQYMVGGTHHRVECDVAVDITAGDAGHAIAASDGRSYIQLSCYAGQMSLGYSP